MDNSIMRPPDGTHSAEPRAVLITVVVYNEGARVQKVLNSLASRPDCCDVLIVDDASSDDTGTFLAASGFPVIRHAVNAGVGAGIKDSIDYGLKNGNRFLVVMAGNGKMDPVDIPKLIQPLLNNECDYVQGSRYLDGGRWSNVPLFRHIMIKIFTWIVAVFTGFKGTDVTCGFRAYSLSLFRDHRINIWQDWLNRYELEFYLHNRVIKYGYRIKETPVGMTYPVDGRAYSKIRPFAGWWSMVRPWVLLTLRLRS
ncbi:MAG: glycosyltransferase family 2 protein [Acidobacteriota bacterium]|nr:glycosyltransferase family 2 protein [Acidobacteriota bacterium]